MNRSIILLLILHINVSSLQKDTDDEVKEHLRQNLHLQDKVRSKFSTSIFSKYLVLFLYMIFIDLNILVPQSDDPAVQWQLNLYKDVVVKSEEPANPEHTVDRVQSISAAVFHLEQVKKKTQLLVMTINMSARRDMDKVLPLSQVTL